MRAKFLLLAGCAAMLASCTNDPFDEGHVPVSGAPQIHISGSIDQTYTTRVDDGGFCDGDQIGLYGVNYTDKNATQGILLDSGNQVDNARYTYNEELATWESSSAVYYKDAETNIDLYAYYPYGTVDSVNGYLFEVQQDQSGGNAINGYGASDFLWAKKENVSPSEAKVVLRFSHRLSCAHVVLAKGDGFAEGEFEALDKTVLVMNTTRKATIDLSTGVAAATGDVEREGIVMKSGEDGFKAIVVPQSVEAGAALFSITIDGIPYRFKKSEKFTYEAGMQSKFTITINKKTHSGEYELVLTDTEIIDWIADLEDLGGEARQYYVVHLDKAGSLGDKLREAKKDPAKIKNLKVSGKISQPDFVFMRDSMALLQAVNLKESEIVAQWQAKIKPAGASSYIYVNFDGMAPADSKERNAIIKEAYPGCSISSNLSSQTLANEISVAAFSPKKTLTNFSFPEKVTKIGEYAFSGCALLSGALIIPDGVVEIGEHAFNDCANLTSLSLPIGLETIGKSAFYQCNNLSGTLNIPHTVTYIDANAFSYCARFTGPLVLPEGLTYLGASAFNSCSGFSGDLKIPEGIKELKDQTFYGCDGLDGQLILHDNLTFESGTWGIFNGCKFQGELKLPAKLKTIPEKCFYDNNFSSIAGFPDGLLEIGDEAFLSCSRLTGILEFPESLVSLGVGAFASCSTLEGIVLPSELGLLKSKAFKGCYYLNKIVCKSLEPPTITSDVFSGVAKDNFTVEVPEKSINRYQSDRYWSEFKRIGAHHDFSISRREMRVLNSEHSRTLLLRAPSGQAWSIESKPDWVTVTPSEGVGKTEVVVTIAEMGPGDVGKFTVASQKANSTQMQYKTYKGRGGEVVFLLNSKDYRSTLKVEQYDYQYGDGDVIVNQTASVGKGVNIVFMGDCFDAQAISTGKYLAGINEAIGYYFDVEPYKTYKEYFNIYTVFGVSNDSGMGTPDTIRDAKFGSQYSLEGIAPDHATCYEYAMKAESVNEDNLGQTLVVLVENTTDYGGICYMWGDGSAIACCPMSDDAYPYDFRGIVQHEAGGHGFGKLADEYIYHNAFIQACGCSCCEHLDEFRDFKALGWYRNLESVGDMEKVGWSHMIFHPKYSNIVDIYEGGYFHTRGIFRSEPNSCMNNNIPYFSAISRQEIVERIMRYAGEEFSIDDFYAKDVLDMQGNNSGSAKRLHVEENAITLKGASKQLPPKYMGDKPQLR